MEAQPKKRMMIVGNWKSWGVINMIKELCNLLLNKLQYDTHKIELVVAPGYLHIPLARALLNDTIEVAAQDASQFGNGEYTGEVSSKLLKEHKVKWVILGHSERREKYGEKDDVIAKKLEHVMAHGMNAIVCIGEKLEEKDDSKTDEVIHRQMSVIKGIVAISMYDDKNIDKVVSWDRVAIAYEPLWTYNTGRSISSDQAQDSMEIIKKWIKTNVSLEAAAKTRLIYGGTVNEKNCTSFLEMEDVDGLLIGSKSVDPKFRELFENCVKIQKYM